MLKHYLNLTSYVDIKYCTKHNLGQENLHTLESFSSSTSNSIRNMHMEFLYIHTQTPPMHAYSYNRPSTVHDA